MGSSGNSIIGVLLNPVSSHSRGIITGLRQARRPGWRYVSARSGLSGIARLRAAGVQAVIGAFSTPDQVAAAEALGVPLINMGYGPVRVPTVVHDDRAVGRRAAAILREAGHRHLAAIGPKGPWASQRIAAFQAEVQRHGLPRLPVGPAVDLPFTNTLPEPTQVAAWIKGLPRPLAIFAVNDLMGVLVLDACASLGLQVPAEVAVLGVDDDPDLCELVTPTLSSLHLPPVDLGIAAADLLERRLAGARAPRTPLRIPPPGSWTPRASTAGAPSVLPRVLAWMTGAIARHVTIGEGSRELGIPRRTIEAAFARELGRSPAEELLRRRIARATELLRSGSSVAEAAAATGFARPDRLAAAMRRLTGQAPRDLRQARRA